MKYIQLTFAFLLCYSVNTFSQTPASECSEAEIICDFDDLDGYTFTMPAEDSPGSQPLPICPDGGAPHNISWVGFIAHEGDYTLNLYGLNCSGSTTGVEGIQYGIYTDCMFTESVICKPDCSIDTLSLDSGNLTPGNEYFLFVDGCSGSVCEIIISIAGDYSGQYCDPVSTNELETILPNRPDITLYPNPVSDLLFIESKYEFDALLIYDLRSQIKIHESLENLSFEATANVTGWSKGIYLIETRGKEGSHFSKFVVE